MFYAGIGSRKTPPDILVFMTILARYMAKQGYILRSGAAQGADSAFEKGAGTRKEIFTAYSKIPTEAFATVDQFHPQPQSLNPFVRKLMARNAMQILGQDMHTPVEVVFCWTPDAANGTTIPTSRNSGGTGQAIRIAAHHNIPVYNLKDQESFKKLVAKMKQ